MNRHRSHIKAEVLHDQASSVPKCACGQRLEANDELDADACLDCQTEAAGCTNGRPRLFVPNNPITRAEIDGALLRSHFA